jgi:hypothetical protein
MVIMIITMFVNIIIMIMIIIIIGSSGLGCLGPVSMKSEFLFNRLLGLPLSRLPVSRWRNASRERRSKFLLNTEIVRVLHRLWMLQDEVGHKREEVTAVFIHRRTGDSRFAPSTGCYWDGQLRENGVDGQVTERDSGLLDGQVTECDSG